MIIVLWILSVLLVSHSRIYGCLRSYFLCFLFFKILLLLLLLSRITRVYFIPFMQKQYIIIVLCVNRPLKYFGIISFEVKVCGRIALLLALLSFYTGSGYSSRIEVGKKGRWLILYLLIRMPISEEIFTHRFGDSYWKHEDLGRF